MAFQLVSAICTRLGFRHSAVGQSNHGAGTDATATTAFTQQTKYEEDPPPYQESPKPRVRDKFLDCCDSLTCPVSSKLSRTPFDGQAPGWVLREIFLCHAMGYTATLHVVAKNLPTLMKDGFFWDERNVVPEDGCVIEGIGWLQHYRTCKRREYHTRCYSLRDKGKDPQWVAFLEVCTKKGPDLGNFRLQALSPTKIVLAHGFNPRDEMVYRYDAGFPPHWDFNAIYDGMRLKGSWPVLRRRPVDGVGGSGRAASVVVG